MVQAVITLTEHENRVINIVKGKFGLRNKSDAIEYIVNSFEEQNLEPELRPDYIEKMKEREKEETVKVKDLRNHFGLR